MKHIVFPAAIAVAAAIVVLAGTIACAAESAAMSVSSRPYGKLPDGTQIDLYTLTNGRGVEVCVMTLGATLTTVRAPDRDGRSDIITLHRKSFEEYRAGHPLLGSVVGRYANRIAGARFVIDGTEYKLDANAGKHHIHGGRNGFQWLPWKAQPVREDTAVGVRLELTSPDGHMGYPGTLHATVVYRLTAENELFMEYTAATDRPTHVNLTNHAYWNLAGADSGDVLEHVIQINADGYLAADEALIPTGEIVPVKGTPLDFTEPRPIGSRITELPRKYYDHCYVLRSDPGGRMVLAARVVEKRSGRVMEVHTTQPGMQFYTGNPRGFCLETQHYPDSPNQPKFPSTLLRPGQKYHQVTMHRFGVEK